MWGRAWLEAALERAGRSTFCLFFVLTHSLYAALGAMPGDLLATPLSAGVGVGTSQAYGRDKPSPPRAEFLRQPPWVEPGICHLAL